MAENKEVEIKGAVKPISLKQTNIILNQMQTCVCKIHNGQKKGTGFFLKIPYQKNDLPVLITNNHVLGEEKIAEGQLITLSLQSLNDVETTINIEIDNGRKRYTNEILDVTIIELNDNDNIKHFLTLDKKVINIISSENKDKDRTEYFNNIYESISLYILKYVENNILASFGLLKQISKNSIYHKCSTEYGSSGAPIISLETNEVIGVHFGSAEHTHNINKGTFLVEPIRQFQRMTDNILVIKKPKASNNCSRNNINNNLDSGDSNIKTKSIDNNNNLSQQLTETESHVFQNDNDNDKHKDTIVLDQNKLKEREINPKVDKSKDKESKEINKESIEKNHQNNNQTSINNDPKKYQERNRDFINHLIKFIFFKKEIQSKTSSFQKGLTKVYAVNRKIIQKLMEIFKINKIIENLNKNKILDQITYFNFDKNYIKILKFLHDNNINNNIEEIKLTENERVLAFQNLNDQKIYLI